MLNFARENGWVHFVLRRTGGAFRRVRDVFTARKLKSPNFRVGRYPRLLGLSHMRIGKNFNAGDGLWLEAITVYGAQEFSPSLVIEDDVTVSDNVHIACLSEVTIGSGTLVGSRVIITDHAHGVYKGPEQSNPETRPADRVLHSVHAVSVGRNVWIGDGVAVLAGATIGDGAIIGANSVVTNVIPPRTLAVGAPARPTRSWDGEVKQWLPVGQ